MDVPDVNAMDKSESTPSADPRKEDTRRSDVENPAIPSTDSLVSRDHMGLVINHRGGPGTL